MRVLSALVAMGSLVLTVVLLPVPGGVLLAMFSFGLFLLAVLGVFATFDDRTVREHTPAMNPSRWRDDGQ